MKEALHTRESRRRRREPALNPNEKALLARPEHAAMLVRLEAATTEFYPARRRHIERVALQVLKARGAR